MLACNLEVKKTMKERNLDKNRVLGIIIIIGGEKLFLANTTLAMIHGSRSHRFLHEGNEFMFKSRCSKKEEIGMGL